ncbi:MAG: hypothetical protein Q8P93_03815 [bacterium]|nr:hypothetical protein [bacterium]
MKHIQTVGIADLLRWIMLVIVIVFIASNGVYRETHPESIAVKGDIIPVVLGDIGLRLIETGVIDLEAFEALYVSRGGMPEDLLLRAKNDELSISTKNAGFLLNVFWALGLGNKNDVLENGPIQDTRYGDPGSFASVGGWTLAHGKGMDHYSQHVFMTLTPDQQERVESVSAHIYRPCCNNSTYFPDCNHGMAMLGLLELMASQGASEEQMYETALVVHSYWFPDVYATISEYVESTGTPWDEVDPREVLGIQYSSARGFENVITMLPAQKNTGSGGCSV